MGWEFFSPASHIIYGGYISVMESSAEWPWPWLHRSSGRAGEVVSRSPRTHYRDCGWRVWRRRARYGTRGYATHSERRCPEHIRLSRDRIFGRHDCNRIVYAESARLLEA